MSKFTILHDLPFIKKGQTVEYDEINKRFKNVENENQSFLKHNSNFYFKEIINQEIGELSPHVFEFLLGEKEEDQFLNFEWCVICTTGNEYTADGFNTKEDTIDHLKIVCSNEERNNWFLYKCFHHKKEVEVKFEIAVTLKES